MTLSTGNQERRTVPGKILAPLLNEASPFACKVGNIRITSVTQKGVITPLSTSPLRLSESTFDMDATELCAAPSFYSFHSICRFYAQMLLFWGSLIICKL